MNTTCFTHPQPEPKAAPMSNTTTTHTAVTPELMSPEWCAGLQQTIAEVHKAAQRPASPATAAANRILSAVNAAGRLPHHPRTVQTWTGAQPQRLWDKTCITLRDLITPEDHRTRMLRDHHVALLATLPMQFLQVAAQLFAEVASALLASAAGEDCRDLKIKLDVQVQELVLNCTITPSAVDAHQTLTREAAELVSGRAVEIGVAEPVVAIAQTVAEFARALCLLAEQHAPGSNLYAALVGDEFMADSRRIQELAHRQ